MIPADPPPREAVGRGLPATALVMDDGRSVPDSKGSAVFVSTDAGAPDAGGAVNRAGALEASTNDGGTAVDIESELVGMRPETVGIGLGTVGVGLGVVDVGLGIVGVGLGIVGVALVGRADDTTEICKGTSTEAWAAGGCPKAAVAGFEDGRASGSIRAEEEIRAVLSVPVDDVPATASVGAAVPSAGCAA